MEWDSLLRSWCVFPFSSRLDWVAVSAADAEVPGQFIPDLGVDLRREVRQVLRYPGGAGETDQDRGEAFFSHTEMQVQRRQVQIPLGAPVRQFAGALGSVLPVSSLCLKIADRLS